MAARPHISISMEAEILKRVDKLVKLTKSNRSRLIQDLVSEGLDWNESSIRATSNPLVMGAFTRAMSEPGVMRGLATAMREDLTDEQMVLFGEATRQLQVPEQKKRRR